MEKRQYERQQESVKATGKADVFKKNGHRMNMNPGCRKY